MPEEEYSETNACSHLPEFPLESIDFLKSLSAVHAGEISMALGFAIAVWCLGAIHIYSIFRYTNNEKRQGKLYTLALLFPIMATSAIGSMLSPRSANLLKSIGLFYILLSLYTAMSLFRYLFPSTREMACVLNQTRNKISMQTPPLCCCCPFLPKFDITPIRIRLLEILTFQAPIVRIIMIIVNILLITDKGYNHNWVFTYEDSMNVIGIISLILAIYGGHMYARIFGETLSVYRTMGMFRFIDISIAIFTAQMPLILESIFVKTGVISCIDTMTAKEHANFINCLLVCVECFLMSLLATNIFKPEKCALLDAHPCRLISVPSKPKSYNDLLNIDA